MSLGLTQTPTFGAWTPEPPPHKSAGLAFLLSLFIPGCGQLYCGKTPRGFLTLGFTAVGIALCFTPDVNSRGVGIATVFCLWVFGFLDAYFTAQEINAGTSEQVDASNPRVAVVLNLLTAGLGYFYLGERTKGIILFILINALKMLIHSTSAFWSGVTSLFTITVALVMAADAYRLAREEIHEAIGNQEPLLNPASKPSRLPAFVPVSLAVLAGIGFCGLTVVGLAIQAARLSDPSLANRAGRRITSRSLNHFASDARRHENAMVEADFLPAIQDVERIQRKTDRGMEDLQTIEKDANRISTALRSGALDDADIKVGYFYRGVAGGVSNSIRKKQGLEIDTSLARQSIADFDQIASHGGNTYDPAVNPANAQYWSGFIQRNDLHSEADAYSMWDKCAQKGHAGCLNIMANAHVTGSAGQKVDIPTALNMHLAVFRTGVRSRCAGAYSARSIARITHFTGVRPPDGDELAWLQKAYDLMDKVPTTDNMGNSCGRASAEVEEFLYRLQRGERRESLLADAKNRLGDSSLAMRATIDLLSGDSGTRQFEAAVESDKSEDQRCSAYFDALWYARLRKKGPEAQNYFQRMTQIGDFYCGSDLVYARKLNP